MNNEFKTKKFKDATVYVLESATAGGTSGGSVASVSSGIGGVQRRKPGQNLIAQEGDKDKVDASKPRNFVAKNAKMGGAGAHKDKKKAAKQGDVKHKSREMDMAEADRTMSRAAKGVMKYGKDGMKALAKAGREGASEKTLDTIRDKHNHYNEEWSQKYKKSINCSHPKGFSQKAHCAGKKKHNEDMTMESVCPDCGMCETHGDHMMEVKQRLDAKCWKGKHKEGTKIKGGVRVNNCVPNEGVAEGSPTMWEVSFDYGPHMTKTVKVKAGSKQEAKAKVEKAAEKSYTHGIMINWVKPVEQGVAEGWKEKVGAAALAGAMATGASANTPKVPVDKAIQQATAVYNINKAVKKHKEQEAEKPKSDEKKSTSEGQMPKTWHDVDKKLGKAVDKMSQAEKVKKGLAHPDTLKKKGVAEGMGDISNPFHPMNPMSPINPVNIARATGGFGHNQQAYQEISNITLGLSAVLGAAGAGLVSAIKNLFKHPENATTEEIKQVQAQIKELYKKTQTLKTDAGRAKAQEELKAAYEVLEELKAKIKSGVAEGSDMNWVVYRQETTLYPNGERDHETEIVKTFTNDNEAGAYADKLNSTNRDDDIYYFVRGKKQGAMEDHSTATGGWGQGAYAGATGSSKWAGAGHDDSVHESPDWYNDEANSMSSAQLKSLVKHAAKLRHAVKIMQKQGDTLEPWQQSKVTKAADYLDAVFNAVDDEHDMSEGDHPDEKEDRALIRKMVKKQALKQEDSYMAELYNKLAEKLKANDPVDKYIHDFAKAAKTPNAKGHHQFKNKSAEKVKQMAIAASYGAKNPGKKKK